MSRLRCTGLIVLVLFSLGVLLACVAVPVEAKSHNRKNNNQFDAAAFQEQQLKARLIGWGLAYPDVALAFALTAAKYKYLANYNLYNEYDLINDARFVYQNAQSNPQAIKDLLSILGDELRNAYELRLSPYEREKLAELLDNQGILPGTVSGRDRKAAEFQDIQFFESTQQILPEEQRSYAKEFPQKSSRYICFEITYKNLNYMIREEDIPYRVEYYNPDGSYSGACVGLTHPNKEWKAAVFTEGRGWETPGLWPLGSCTAKVWFDGTYIGQYSFRIY